MIRILLTLASAAALGMTGAAVGDETPPAPIAAQATSEPSAPPTPAANAAPPAAADVEPDSPAPGASADDAALPDANLEPIADSVKADLDQQVKSLESAGLSDADKQLAVKLYQQALESFNVANQQLATAREYQKRLDTLEADVAFESQRLNESLKPYEPLEDLTLAEVEQRAATVETSLKSYRDQLADLEAEPKRRSNRLAALPKEIADFQERTKQAAEALAAFGNEDVKDAGALARRAALTLNHQRLSATVKALEREQRLYQQGGEYIKLRRDYFARYVPYKEKRLVQLREEINRRRELEAQIEARHAAEQARLAAQTSADERPEVLAELAKENESLAQRRAEIVANNTRISQEGLAANDRLAQLKKRSKSAQDQVQIAEFSDFNGDLFRRELADLPKLHDLRRRSVARHSERANVLIELYALNDSRSALANIDDLMDRLAVKAPELSPAGRDQLRTLLEAKRNYLDDLIADYGTYSDNLNKLDSAESQLVALTEEYSAFIARRVLWIRSAAPIGPADLRPAGEALAWTFDPGNWRDAGHSLLAAARRNPFQVTFGAAAFLALLGVQRPVRRRLHELGEEAAKRSCTRLRPTIHALWLTAIHALPWPWLLAGLGWTLNNPLNESEFVRALGAALGVTALCLLVVELLRNLCRRDGLAEAHFDWPEPCLSQLRRKLRWITSLAPPLILWLVGLEVQSTSSQWSSSLGRACFAGVMLLFSAVLQRLLLSRGNPFRQLVLYSERGWLTPLQITWRPAVVLLPTVLALLAAAGYYYTAQQAAMRLVQTVSLVLAVLVLGGLTRRWLLVSRRRLAREQAKQRRAQLAAAAEADPTAPPPPEAVEDIPDLAALSEQTQKLVRTFLAITTTAGIVIIWAAILPALAYLGQAQINPSAVADGAHEPLTWAQLFKLLAVLFITFVSVRDVPALLELVILQHLPLDGGFRYAFTTLCRYVLAAVGITVAFNCIGWDWADVQWLVAAMSVGLGFGLQEIFANFVSGVILLFERPIRVGDIVTLGEKTGVVNRIRMRATTIVDWDRKEYIVPNKDLVTERLLNWTLSDTTNRIEVVVNVAGGSDTDEACTLLLQAAREQPHVLDEPSPAAMFESFSDNGLKLVLRCYLPSLENRGSTIHALHTAIDRKLRAAGIETAYGDMRVRLARDAAAASSARPAFTAKAGRQGAA